MLSRPKFIAKPGLQVYGGLDGERFARAYNGGLGTEPLRGPEPLVRGSGAEIHSLFQGQKGEIWPNVYDFSVVLKLVQQSKNAFLPHKYCELDLGLRDF